MVPCYLIQAVLSEFMDPLTRRAALAKRKSLNGSDVVDALGVRCGRSNRDPSVAQQKARSTRRGLRRTSNAGAGSRGLSLAALARQCTMNAIPAKKIEKEALEKLQLATENLHVIC